MRINGPPLRRMGAQAGLYLSVLAVGTAGLGVTAADEPRPRIIDELVIVGTPERRTGIPGSAYSLDSEELERHDYGDIYRVLRGIPGVNTHEEEGFGLFPNIGLRGTRLERNSRITVMEDGVLIAPAPYTAPAAYYFPQIARMSRVEVRKGSAAIQYGPYTTGGAINLVSTPVPEVFAARGQLQYGEHGGRRVHAWAGDTQGDWGWLLEGLTARSTGFKRLDLPTDDAFGRPNAPSANTGFDADNYLGKVRWASSGAGAYQEVELKLARDERTANETYLGLTAADFAADPFRRYAGSQLDQINTRHEQYQVTHLIETGERTTVTTIAYYNEFARNWYKLHAVQNEAAGSFIGISGILDDPQARHGAMAWLRGVDAEGLLGNVRANNREYYSRGIQAELAHAFSGRRIEHELRVGLRYHEDEEDRFQWQDSFRMANGSLALVRPGREQGAEAGAESGIPGSTTNRVTDARAWALSIQNTMRLGGLTLTPGLRIEDISFDRRDYFEGADPNRDGIRRGQSSSTRVYMPGLGATHTVGEHWILLGGVHRGFAPTGPGTDEETSWNYEAGVRYRRDTLEADVIAFHTRYDNIVGVCTAASGGGCEIGEEFDGGRDDVNGLEVLAQYDLGAALGLPIGIPASLSYTWTDTEFRSSFASSFTEWGNVEAGDELPQIPSQQVNVGLGIGTDAWQLNLNANYVNATRAFAGSGPIADAEKIDSRVLVDLGAEYRVHDNFTLFANIENLTDREYLVALRPAGGRPGLPRTAWVGVKMRL